MKKIISVVMIISIVLCSTCVSFATPIINEYDIIANKAESIINADPSTITPMSVSSVKPLRDFAGNLYYAVEFETTGYLIYHPDSQVAVEYSSESRSPYYGLYEHLYYVGPTNYYTIAGGKYIHTITGEELAEEQYIFAQELSRTTKSALENTYREPANVEGNLVQPNTVVSGGITYIDNYSYIKNLRTETQMGFWDGKNDGTKEGGVCGFIAAAIMLLYYDRTTSVDFVPDSYMSGDTFNGNRLTKELVALWPNHSTWADEIESVLETYCSSRGITISTWSPLVPATQTIKSHINFNRPVIVFGKLANPKGGEPVKHAVTVYGYAGDTLYAHYGWPGYSHVAISSSLPWGSGLCITGY